jgi:glycosyltransferase involved in cell wall biosynthesis
MSLFNYPKEEVLMSVESLYVVWSKHSPRAETLSTELKMDGQVSFQYEEKLKAIWLLPLRYLVQGWKTWRLLEQQRPQVVLVQSPPIFALLVVAAWCELSRKIRFSGKRTIYVLDCHTATWHHRKWRWARPLMRLLSQRATVTLCHDEGALDILRIWKARGFFLSDGIPLLSPPTGTIGSEGETRVGVIGSLDPDEPVAEVFAAARLLPQVTFYVTGDPKKLSANLLNQKPENVILTGFLRGGTYAALLKNVHGLVVLTNESNALNCAAHEAVAMEKPTVVSDWPEMRHYFTRGFIYVNNTPVAIADGIQKMLNERAQLAPEVKALRSELVKSRQPKLNELAALLNIGTPA